MKIENAESYEDLESYTDVEKDRLFTHWAGRASSLEDAAKHARLKSGEYFANSKDAEAKIWRDFADWLETMAKANRKKQQEFK